MKIEVKTKKKPSVPSVKTMGVKKKATASGVAVKGKKAAIAKEGKKAAIAKEVKKTPTAKEVKKTTIAKEGKKAAIAKEGKKAAIAKEGKKAAIAKAGKKAVASSAKEAAAKKKTAKVTPAAKKDAAVDSQKVDVKPKKVENGKQMKKAVNAASAVKAGPKKKQKEGDKGSKPEGKKKRMRRKSRKPKVRKVKVVEETQAKPEGEGEEEEKPDSTGKQKRKSESSDDGSPAKKQKGAEKKREPANMEMDLTGELYKIFCKRRDELKDRALYATVENFKLGYYSKPPALFSSAQHVRICAEKGVFYLEYKTKKEAEKHKLILENNSLIKHVKSLSKDNEDGDTDGTIKVHPRKLFIANVPPRIKRDMLVTSFPTAKYVRVLPKTRCAYLIYKTEEEAEDAFVLANNVQVKGVKLTVLYLSTRKAEELGKNTNKIKEKMKKKRAAYKKSVQKRKNQLNNLESQTDSSKKNG